MIERLTIENFKSLRKVDLRLGRLNFLIGTNASGKSNLLDAMQVLRLVLGRFPIKELFEGGVETSDGDTWPGLRGRLSNAIYRAPSTSGGTPSAEAILGVEIGTEQGKAGYSIAFNDQGVMTRERLTRNGEEVYFLEGGQGFFRNSDGLLTPCYPAPWRGSQMLLGFESRFAGAHTEFVGALVRTLQHIQFLELDPEVLRAYGKAGDAKAMGRRGENFASVVRSICSDPKTKTAYLNWLKELRPDEVEDVLALPGAVGDTMFALKESGRQFPAEVLSEGTLRFAALAAAFFQPSMPQVLAIEEVENGIHGSRLRLLLELFRSQTAATKTQLLATTHSPLLLGWLRPEEYETTFLCKRVEETGESRIVPLAQVPHFSEIISQQPISELIAEGWLEAAV